MPALKLRRIDLSASGSAAQIVKLRDQYQTNAEVASAASKKKTVAVFGEALPPARAVERICNDVRDKGLAAALQYTEAFDGIKLKPDQVRVKPAEMAEAHATVGNDFLEVVRQVRDNVVLFQSGLLHSDAVLNTPMRHDIQVRYRPLKRVGVYCPGGAAAYPSTLLMTVCPAQVPPASRTDRRCACRRRSTGAVTTAKCWRPATNSGSRKSTDVGGAQAIAAMAYGVEGLPPVDMIVGPGNHAGRARQEVRLRSPWPSIASRGRSEIVVRGRRLGPSGFRGVGPDRPSRARTRRVAILVTWYEPLIEEMYRSPWRSGSRS